MQNASKPSAAKGTASFESRYNRSILALTGLYAAILAVILFISGTVSFTAFSSRVSRRFDRFPPPAAGQLFAPMREDQRFPTANEVRRDFVESLIIVNASMLMLAGLLSYFLARMTLKPIKKSYDAQRQFLADASHELRTPLAVLQLALENEQADPRASAPARERAASNLEEIRRMARIVSDLLLISRLDDGRMETLGRSIELKPFLAGIAAQLSPLAESRGVTLSLDGAVPDIALPADEGLLSRAVTNVVENAILYNRPGGKAKIIAAAASASVTITVVDTGTGIAQKHIGRVFDRFYRADESRTRATGGSGLGLAIARSSIEHLGGSIRLESEFAAGTTVTITLPRA